MNDLQNFISPDSLAYALYTAIKVKEAQEKTDGFIFGSGYLQTWKAALEHLRSQC